MALPALQSSLKRKTGAWEPNRGIRTHQFSPALNTPLSAIHQALTDLFTTQSGFCLAARYTSKCSFDTLSLSPPALSLLSLSCSDQLMESAEMSGQFMAGVALLKGSAGSDETTTPCQADGTHSSCKSTSTPKQRLTNSPLFDWMFLFLCKKKKKEEKKSFLQAAPQDFPWGLDETQ